jgi:hypothetical protein
MMVHQLAVMKADYWTAMMVEKMAVRRAAY